MRIVCVFEKLSNKFESGKSYSRNGQLYLRQEYDTIEEKYASPKKI